MSGRSREARWRLVLGAAANGVLGGPAAGRDVRVDEALGGVYDRDGAAGRKGGAAASRLARWLGELRDLFPTPVVQVVQADAVERLGLRQLLLEPELIEAMEVDVHLVGLLLQLRHHLPDEAAARLRPVVARLVERLRRQLAGALTDGVRRGLAGVHRTTRPRAGEIDWPRTLRANLQHWQPGRGLVLDRLIGRRRRQRAVADLVLAVDQSGSMAASVVHATIAAAVLAGLPALRTRFAVFDTQVVDLTEGLDDPVGLLLGAQLGGGTHIAAALAWVDGVVERPAQTTAVLVTDLYEGGPADVLVARAAGLVDRGVHLIVLLALADEGRPSFDADVAGRLAALGVPCVAVTPDRLPELLAVALRRGDVAAWAALHQPS